MIDSKDIPKAYTHSEVEKKWFDKWNELETFHAPDVTEKENTYSIVIPPPNVTGILHMGHALNNTLQDILIRFKRMQDYEALWMPGTDHAGIATQNVVEKALRKDSIHREDLGREKFIDQVWSWKEKYGNTIIEQLKRMGCSCDWPRTRFTMDDGLSDAVKEVFVRLFDKGLIYKNHYIINWCTRCQTALSDEEVTHRDLQGALYHIKYAIKDSDQTVVIATTRPETLLGDTALGFNPNDDRYSSLKGKVAILPILNRELQIIQDETIDPEFGTGALKITPGHDPVDFELGNKHSLQVINILNPDGTLNEEAGPYKGLDRFEARKKIVEKLKEDGILIEVTKHTHSVGHCYRCDSVVEPYCSDQWFVKMKPLAEPAIKALHNGDIKFHPERWSKIYLNWMENIRDWCISRQIWWGHKVPVYYTEDGKYTAARSEKEARERLKLKEGDILTQDQDVLDTWFSSWLWPFSTMGWPNETSTLKTYYPTQSLVTGYEIIFFWVARMIMSSLEFMKTVPFKDIYIHGIVRDETGSKMSKSKGNVIDPLEIIDEYGADALRFSMISITSEGQDVYASKERCEIGRNFANKVWNASRFVIQNLKSTTNSQLDVNSLDLKDSWILSRTQTVVDDVSRALNNYKFNEASTKLYDFFWGEFCSYYIELAKKDIDSNNTQVVLRYVLGTSMKLLHPFMPFITEEVWEWLNSDSDTKSKPIMIESWPEINSKLINENNEEKMGDLIQLIHRIRLIRGNWKVPNKEKVGVVIKTPDGHSTDLVNNYSTYIKALGKVGNLSVGEDLQKPEQSALEQYKGYEVYVVLKDIIDVEKEIGKIQKNLDELNAFIKQVESKLNNKNFVGKAPADVVEKQKQRYQDLQEQKKRLEENLSNLSTV